MYATASGSINHGSSSKSCMNLLCPNFTVAASGKYEYVASWPGCSGETVVAILWRMCTQLRRVGRHQ
jgi:hypothetical protein